jgi:hypothetical protein
MVSLSPTLKKSLIHAQEFQQLCAQICLIFDLQEQRCAELARLGNETVVDLDLVADLIQIGDSFRPKYLLMIGGSF